MSFEQVDNRPSKRKLRYEPTPVPLHLLDRAKDMQVDPAVLSTKSTL
jgi:hypothetical protein